MKAITVTILGWAVFLQLFTGTSAQACAKDGNAADSAPAAQPVALSTPKSIPTTRSTNFIASGTSAGSFGAQSAGRGAARQNLMSDKVFGSVGGAQTPYSEWSSDTTK